MIDQFFFYDPATGVIGQSGTVPQGYGHMQIPPPGQRRFDLPVGGPTLEKVFQEPEEHTPFIQAVMWERVKMKRDAIINQGVPIPGVGVIQTDLESRLNLTASALAAQLDPDFSETWTNEANQTVTLTGEQMKEVALAARRFVSAAHARSRALREQLAVAGNVTELLMIDIDSGWPDELSSPTPTPEPSP